MKTLVGEITLVIPTDGNNLQALTLALSSVIMGTCVPASIVVQFNDPKARLDNFNLSQLGSLASRYGVSFKTEVKTFLQNTIHEYRDYSMRQCKSRYLLFLDDDVIVDNAAIRILYNFVSVHTKSSSHLAAFYCGNKVDITDVRGYSDFITKAEDFDPLRCNTFTPYNWTSENAHGLCPNMDTGFALLDLEVIKEHGLTFSNAKQHFNSIAEDTVFGKMAEKLGVGGLFVPNAKAWHLEKPFTRFRIEEIRCELAARTLESIKQPEDL